MREPIAVAVRSNLAPFSAARAFVKQALSDDARENLRLPLRFVLQSAAPKGAGLTELQDLKTQVRFYTKKRCLRELRVVAWTLAETCPDGLSVQVTGPLSPADHDFFSILARHVSLDLNWDQALTSSATNALDLEALADIARAGSAFNSDEDWQWFCRTTSKYLSFGDSWTASQLADELAKSQKFIPGSAAHVASIAYTLQNRTADAEMMLHTCEHEDGLQRARGLYSLALLNVRHHPRAWRRRGLAMPLLDEAWEVLKNLQPTEPILREQALNRNGAALVQFLEGNHDEAIAILEMNLSRLSDSPYDLHKSIVFHNLGRAYSATGRHDKQAESALREAIKIDPRFAEYWLDLALFLSKRERYLEAISAAETALECAESIAETHALLGYLHASIGNHAKAAAAYAQAATLHAGIQENTIAAAREYCEAEDYLAARRWLGRLDYSELPPSEVVSVEILNLEVDSFLEKLNSDEVLARLRALAERYPGSGLVRQNLEALAS